MTSAGQTRLATGVLLAISFQSSCLLSPPANYEEVERVRPTLAAVEPSITEVHVHSPGDTIFFTMEVRSVDSRPDGSESQVVISLYRDYGTPLQDLEHTRVIEPSLDFSKPRLVSIGYSFATTGCYQFTAVATHVDNLAEDDSFKDEGDVSQVTWWILVETPDSPWTLRDCPTAGVQ